MRNILAELYKELMSLNSKDEFSYKQYNKIEASIIECAVIADSKLIRELLITEIKINQNSHFPVWLMLLLFKIYVLQNPNDLEIKDMAIFQLYMHLAIDDKSEIEQVLTINY